ncbi:unnamed protein product, partial [Didymodactylos carnosus]
FTNNMSYQVYNLPRFLGIDYKRNTSLAWHNGDNTPRKTAIKDRILKAIRQPIFYFIATSKKTSTGDTQKFKRLAINVKDYRAKGINLKDNLAIHATVKVIEKTLKTKYNERCDKKIIATTVKTNFNDRDIPDELVFDLPV